MTFNNYFKGVAQRLSAAFLLFAVIAAPFATFIPTAQAAAGASIEQCRNGAAGSPVNCTGSAWVNGNAGSSNSHFVEGESVPYRAILTGLPVGTPVTLTIEYDIKNSSKHALDYLTHYDRITESVDPINGVAGVSGSPSTFPIPAPSSTGSPVAGQPTASFNALPAGERVMSLWGGTISAVAYNAQGNLASANSVTQVDVTFTPSAATAVLAWGGHIGSRIDWGSDISGPRSAGGITGSPYHMRLEDWTLGNLGNQDRSLSAGAVTPPANLIVNKVLVNDNGGTAPVTSFSFTNNAGAAIPFEADASNALLVNVGGTFNIVENAAAGYTTTYSGTCSGTMTAAGAACTITNNDNPASLTVNKVVVGGPLAGSPQSFSFQVDGGSAVAFEQDGSNTLGVNAGAHTITEVAVEDYTPSYDNCSNIQMANGGSAICTITNTYTPRNGTLNITKILGNLFGAIASVTDFSFTVNGGASTPFEADATNSFSLLAGAYTVAENTAAGFAAPIYGGDCPSGSATVVAGETKNCTITNNGIQPTLTLQKTVVNDAPRQYLGTAVDTDFTLSASGPTNISGTEGQAAVTNALVNVGTYNLSESGPTGYTASAWVCTGGTQVDGDTVQVGLGQNVTCVITNNDEDPTKGTLTILKTLVSIADADTDPLETDFILTATGPTNTSGAEGAAGVTGFAVNPGVYTIGEQSPLPAAGTIGYNTAYSCSVNGGDAVSGNEITIAAGDNVTCTVTNTELPQCRDGLDNDNDGETDYRGEDTGCSNPDDNNEQAGGSITINKEVTGEGASTTQTFNFNYGWTEVIGDAALSAIDAPIVINGLDPATYSFGEINIPSRWNVESVVCTSGNEPENDSDESLAGVTVNLSLDENVTCVFTNKYTPRDSGNNEENIIIKKEVTEGSDTGTLFSFDVSWLDNEGPADFMLADGGSWDSGDLKADEYYNVNEIDLPLGWGFTKASACVSNQDREVSIFDDILLHDGETITCTFVNDQELFEIYGNVWEDANENNVKDEENNLAGWMVHITNGEDSFSTTTDENGNYRFFVPRGTWTITETLQGGWNHTFPDTEGTSHVVTVPAEEENEEVMTFLGSIFAYIVPTAQAAVNLTTYGSYDFGNVRIATGCTSNCGGGGSSSGTRVKRDGEVRGDSDEKPVGEVKGAVAPVGAPNTGAGGAAGLTFATALAFATVAALARARKTVVK
jgi:hypothetical protein